METPHTAPSGKKAMTIDQFCLDHSISRPTFYRLSKIGKGPRTMQILGRQLISEEAAAAWRAERTEAA